MIYAKKSLGQNFLSDRNIIKKIVNTIDINGKNILEIGPGTGSLTNEILNKKPKSLLVIEKDGNLAKRLFSKFGKKVNFKIFNEDVLDFNFEKNLKKNTIIFGNLPYNISSQILIKLIKIKYWPPNFTDLILMFQREVAEKIIGKSYGRLTISSNLKLKFIKKFDVSPNCFFPKPKIISSVLHLKPRKKIKYKIKDFKNLENITNIFFSNRRKMIYKSLKIIFNKEKLNKIKDIDLTKRPSDLKPEIYYKFTQLYEEN